MSKLFAAMLLALTGMAIAVLVNVGVMIVGWGLEPKSWLAIIGLNLVGTFIVQCFVQVATTLNKE